MINIELDEEMEMPCMCDCGKWFDLNDGHGSELSNKVICDACHEAEILQIEKDEEILDLQNAISDAEYTLKESRKRLAELTGTAGTGSYQEANPLFGDEPESDAYNSQP